MRFGVHIFPTDESVEVDVLSKEVEDRGFESLWFPEHTHIPTSRRTPWSKGDALPREYLRLLDPFVALTVAATCTQRLKLGSGVCLLAQHDPIVLAKTVATLDQVSAGRFLFGIGLGWNIEEMSDHGVDPKLRRSIVREKVLAMQGLWSQDEFGFEGDYVRFAPSWSWPKPVQRPHPPVLVGGAGGPLGFRHIAEFAAGWMPDLTVQPMEMVVAKIAKLAAACEAVGRDPSTVEVTMVGIQPDPAELERVAALGVSRAIFLLPSAPTDTVFAALDGIQGAVADLGMVTEL
jgi:probable F420-dependent oxidoreductase